MYAVIFEAAIFGSGQMLRVGPVTLRMVLFVLSLIYVAMAQFSGDRIRTSTLLLVLSFLASFAAASLNGLFHAATPQLVGEDITFQLPFLLLPFFELTVRNVKQAERIARIIMFASWVIFFAYIYLSVRLLTGNGGYGDFTDRLHTLGNGDFMEDPSTGRIFYKGAIYVGIALLFFLFHRKRWIKFAAFFAALNLVVVGTRGFFLALLATSLLYFVIGPIRAIRKAVLIVLLLVIVGLLLPRILALGGRTQSNTDRIVTIQQVLARTTPFTVMTGNGFGIGVPVRPEHMEITYLEIFYKQGILGLVWWTAAFLVLVGQFRGALKGGRPDLVYPFFLSCVFVAIESFTNPYLNNSIGMTFIVAAVACLGVLGRSNPVAGEQLPIAGGLHAPMQEMM